MERLTDACDGKRHGNCRDAAHAQQQAGDTRIPWKPILKRLAYGATA